jgi:hypothetical protein
MSHVISMHRPGNPRQIAASDLSKVILCLVAPRFKHTTLLVHAKQDHVEKEHAERSSGDFIMKERI